MKISTTTVKLTVFMHWKLFYDANCCCSASWNCFTDLTSTSILVLQILESPQRVVSLYNYMNMIESNWIIQPFDNRVKRLYCFYFKTYLRESSSFYNESLRRSFELFVFDMYDIHARQGDLRPNNAPHEVVALFFS